MNPRSLLPPLAAMLVLFPLLFWALGLAPLLILALQLLVFALLLGALGFRLHLQHCSQRLLGCTTEALKGRGTAASARQLRQLRERAPPAREEEEPNISFAVDATSTPARGRYFLAPRAALAPITPFLPLGPDTPRRRLTAKPRRAIGADDHLLRSQRRTSASESSLFSGEAPALGDGGAQGVFDLQNAPFPFHRGSVGCEEEEPWAEAGEAGKATPGFQ